MVPQKRVSKARLLQSGNVMKCTRMTIFTISLMRIDSTLLLSSIQWRLDALRHDWIHNCGLENFFERSSTGANRVVYEAYKRLLLATCTREHAYCNEGLEIVGDRPPRNWHKSWAPWNWSNLRDAPFFSTAALYSMKYAHKSAVNFVLFIGCVGT